MEYKAIVEPYVCDVSAYLHEAIKAGKTILLEGQLGTLKDPDHGIYPMVTSSSTLAAYGAIGAGIPPYEIKQIVTVVKAYSSAVGAGEFVSEIFGDEADELRRRGGEAVGRERTQCGKNPRIYGRGDGRGAEKHSGGKEQGDFGAARDYERNGRGYETGVEIAEQVQKRTEKAAGKNRTGKKGTGTGKCGAGKRRSRRRGGKKRCGKR